MSFHEIRFPIEVSLGAIGGPERRTEIVTLGSGFEERNTRWTDSRRRYNAGYGIKNLSDLDQVINFFEERRGRLHGFRWRDRMDYKSCAPNVIPDPLDQIIGTGDGAIASFQLAKTYGAIFSPYVRTISKPVVASVRVAVAGVEASVPADFTIDDTSGAVTFQPGKIPALGASVTAGFEFDVPVRLDTDFLEINLSGFVAGDIPNIPLIEVRV